MKTLIVIILILFSVSVSKAERIPSNCNAPDSITAKHSRYASELTLRKFHRNNISYKDSVPIPKVHIDTVLNALNAIYNATSLKEKDSVISIFKIYTYPVYSTNSFFVTANPDLLWMQQLKKGMFPTGDAAVDGLMNTYHLKVSGFLFEDVVVLRTDSNYNIRALAKLFEQIPGVSYTEPNGYAGDGNDIKDSIFSDHIQLIYSYGWGDCPAGCIYRRYWKFNVYFDCSVEFAGSYGDKLQTTGVHESDNEGISIYPNPCKSYLVLNGLYKNFYYYIYDMNGKIQREGFSTNNRIDNLDNLSPGTYIMDVKSVEFNTSLKFLKE